MSTVSSGEELINIAIDIERRGITFYDVMAKSTDNEMARLAFEALAAMGKIHPLFARAGMSEVGLFKGPNQYYRYYIADRRPSL